MQVACDTGQRARSWREGVTMPLKNCPCCGSGDVSDLLNIGKMVEDIARTYAERVGGVYEKRIHDELVKLGWTPPPEKKDQEG